MDSETDQQKSSNFCKLICLLVDIGGEALRDVLLKEIPQNKLAVTIKRNYTLLSNLKRKKVLSEPQYKLLQEPQPDPSKFDISLLVALLRNICPKIEASTPDWKVEEPDVSDNSIGAEILRLKNIRNSIQHKSSTLMPKATFTPLWSELVGIIDRISTKVNQAANTKVMEKIRQLEHSEIDPSGEKEKKLLKQLEDWQTQIIDIMIEKFNSLQGSLDRKIESIRDDVHAVSQTKDGTNEKLSSLQEQLKLVIQDVSRIRILEQQIKSMRDDVHAVSQTKDGTNEKLSSLQEQLKLVTQDVSRIRILEQQAAGDRKYSETRHADFEELKQHLQILQRNFTSIKQHIYSAQTTTPWQNTVQNPPQVSHSQPPRGPESVGDLSLKDIDRVARDVGFEWERLALFLDYNQGQIDTIKQIYRDQPVTRNVRLIQDWSNIVTQCGDSPRTLLAAAFASMENNEMAQSLVPAEEVEGIKDKEASQEAKIRIREIDFENRPQVLGDILKRQTPVVAVGGDEAVNIFSGDVTFGSVSVHSSLNSASSGPSDRPFPSSIPDSNQNANIGGLRSLNIFGGTVRTKDGETINIGQPSGPSLHNTRNPDICRAEGVDRPNGGAAGTSSGNLKKTVDDTFSETIFNKYNEAMKSVGVLASENIYGTVFRVGSKYVMTAWHVVYGIIDPLKSGVVEWNRLKDKAKVIFSSEVLQMFTSHQTFRVKDVLPLDKNFDNIADLDIVILELDNSTNLPPRLNLYPHEINITQVLSVDIIGYGHPKSHKKTLDPNCRIILPEDRSLQEAQAWLQQNKYSLAQGLGLQTNPTNVDWSFSGYDKAESIIFNCFLEKGSSGAPLFTTVPGDPLVVGVVIKGLPSCFWDLSSTSQQMFPDKYRFEMGTRMNHIYNHLLLSNPGLANDLFQ